jgi:hypothetical protein
MSEVTNTIIDNLSNQVTGIAEGSDKDKAKAILSYGGAVVEVVGAKGSDMIEKKIAARGTNVSKATAKLAKASKVVAKAAGPLADVVVGAMDIADNANNQFMTASEKAYAITGDVLGIAANIGMALLAGPAGIILAITALLGGVLDLLWSPFKALSNKDLRQVEDQVRRGMKDLMKAADLNFPYERKPDLLAAIADEDSIQRAMFTLLTEKYYKENGLINAQDAADELKEIRDLREERRLNRNVFYDEEGYLRVKDYSQEISYNTAAQEEQQLLIKLIALHVYLKQKNIDVKNIKDYKKKRTLANYLKVHGKSIFFFIMSIIILSGSSSIISGVFVAAA